MSWVALLLSTLARAVAAPVLVIGVTGPSGAGKTHFADLIRRYVGAENVAVIAQDSYFKDLAELPVEHAIDGEPNGDHPSAMDTELLTAHASVLKEGGRVQIPRYDFLTDRSHPDGPELGPLRVLIIEGIFVARDPGLRALLDYAIFVDAAADLRLARRLKRDFEERGKDMNETLAYYLKVVRPMQARFIEPTVIFADLRVDGAAPAAAALDLAAEIVRFLARSADASTAYFFDRPVRTKLAGDPLKRGESIQQLMITHGDQATLHVGGSLRPPTLDHVALMIQPMQRFGFTRGKFVPSNSYKPGSINNAAALLLSRVQVQRFDEALDQQGVAYSKFAHAPQTGARWTGADGREYRVSVDAAEIDVANPLVDGEDRRTLLAFERLKENAGGDPKSVFWVAGGDSFASLPTWNSRWQEHLNLSNWIIVTRPEFEARLNNVSFEDHDPIRKVIPGEVVDRYLYYFDHATQTHVYENQDPALPNLYVIRLAKIGSISSTSVRRSFSTVHDQRLVARAGTTPAVFQACLNHGFFDSAAACAPRLETTEAPCAP